MTQTELNKLTAEEKRCRIAVACGWRMGREVEPGRWMWHKDLDGKVYGHEALPNYLNDLNAMHDAEKVMQNSSQLNLYRTWVIALTNNELDLSSNETIVPRAIFATATQRADAFLLAIG